MMPIKGTVECIGCGEKIPVTAYPMVAVETPQGISHTSHPRPDEKIVQSAAEALLAAYVAAVKGEKR